MVDESYILSVIQKHPSYMVSLKKAHKLLRMHYHGIGVNDYVSKITGLENSDQLRLREKYARSNKNLFSNLAAPIDKLFTAKGKNKNYQTSTSSQEKQLKDYIHSVDNGKSLEMWLKSYWKDKIAADPNGIFLIEIDSEGNPYPTYKSILSIRDYSQSGQSLDYIIFEPKKKVINGKEHDTVRVLDDDSDRLYIIGQNNIVLVEDDTYKNELKKVPGCIISAIEDTTSEYKKSSIDEEVELANEYLRDNSVKTIYKLTNGYPIFWMYYSQCPVCKGSKEHNGEPCKSCNGTGLALKKDVSEIVGIKPPESPEDITIAPDIAGYVSPPSENLEQMTGELSLLKDMMFFSHWGSTMESGDNQTATGRFIDVQPVYDRLNNYADCLEVIESILVDYIGAILLKKGYKGCSINYGRRYLVETPDQILDKYIKGIEKGINDTTLTYLLKQYYQTQFATDPMMYVYYEKLIDLEPWIHKKITDIPQNLQNSIDFKKKIYINEWANTLTINDIVMSDLKKLDKILTKYVEQKNIDNEPKEVQ